MRWRLLGLFFFAMAGAAAWTFWIRPETEVWLKNKIQSEASLKLGRDVRLDSLSIHPLLFRVQADGVRVGPAERPLFTCARWTFHTAYAGDATPFAVFSLTLGRSELTNPILCAGNGASGAPRFSLAFLQHIPLHRLIISDGEIRLETSHAPPLVMTNVSGDVDLTPRSVAWTARAKMEDGSLRWQGRLSRSLFGSPLIDIETSLSVADFSLGLVAGRVPPRWGSGAGRIQGTLGARWDRIPLASSPLDVEEFLKQASWSGHFQVDGVWTPPGAESKGRGIPIDGKAAWNNGVLELKDLRFFRALSVTGTVKIPSREAQLRWRGDQIALADLSECGLSFLRSVPRRGALDTAGEFSGTPTSPRCEWTAVVRGAEMAGVSLPEISFSGKWDDKDVSVSARGMGGTVQWERPVARQRHPGWIVEVAGLDLSTLAATNGWRGMNGRVDASFSMAGGERTLPFPTANGRLRVDGFSWAGHRETAPVEGLFQMGPGGARLRGVRGNFDVEIAESPNQWRLERFQFESGGLALKAQGFLKDADGNVRLEGSVSGFPLADVPFVSKRFPDVEGRLSVAGRVHGPWKDIATAGTFVVDGVRWRPGAGIHRAQGQWKGGSSGVTFTDFVWDDAVRAEGTWLFNKGGRLNVELHRTPTEALFDFWPGATATAGTVSGGMSVQMGADKKVQGWARLNVDQGRWNNFTFDTFRTVGFIKDDKLELESLELRVPGGAWTCRASVQKRAGGSATNVMWDWEGSGTIDGGPERWAGLRSSWTTRGQWFPGRKEGRGAWSSPSVFCGRPVPADAGAVQAVFSWSPNQFRLDNLRAQCGLTASAAVTRADGALAGRFQLADLSLSTLFAGASLFQTEGAGPGPWVLGRVNGNGTLGGTWKSPTAQGRVSMAQSRWKEMSFSAEAEGVWDRHLEVSGAQIRFKGGGAVEAKGRWVPGPVPEARLDARLSETPLALFLNSFGMPTGRGGLVEGNVSLAGPVGSMAGTVSLSARGFGPEDEPMDANGRFVVKGSSATVEEAVVKTSEGFWRVRPGGGLALSQNRLCVFRLDNDVRNLRLGPLRLFGGAGFDGAFDLQAKTLSGRVRGDGLWVNRQIFDGDMAHFVLARQAVEFETVPGAKTFLKGRVRLGGWPQLFFENLTLWDSGERKMVLAGELGPARWDFSLHGRGLEADALLPLADIEWPLTGPWDVQVRGLGSYQTPNVTADVSGGPGFLGVLPYDRIAAQARWVNDRIEISGLRLTRRKGFTVTGEAKIPVRREGVWEGLDLNVRIDEGKAAILKDVWSLCRSARGDFSGELAVTPGRRVPRVTGYLNIKDGSLRLYNYAPRVTEINGNVTFQNDRARVEHARARVGKGWIEMAGDVGIRGASPVEYDLSIQTDGERGVYVEVPQLSVPPGPLLGRFSFLSEKLKGITYGEPRLSMRIKGPHGRHTISGTVELERTHFTYPPGKSVQGEWRGPRWWKNIWQQARWDVVLNTAKDTWYRNEYVDVKLRGGLALAGGSGDWKAHGRVDADEGVINYLGQLFTVNRGTFELVTDTRPALGNEGIQPYLSGEAQRTVTTVDGRGLSTDDTIYMVVDRALIKDLQPRFVSRNSPDMKSDRVAMKALGVSSDQPFTQSDRDQLLKAGLIQLAGSSAAPAANRLAQKFGIDMISPIYEPPASQEEVPTVASVNKTKAAPQEETLSEYLRGAGAAARVRLTDRLSGVYKVKWEESKDQTYFRDQIELILRVKGSVHMRASTELDSQSLLGQPPERRLALENVWRFGLPSHRRTPTEKESNQ